MILEDTLLLILSVITLIITVPVLSYYLLRLRRLNESVKESSGIVGIIVTELRNRLKNQDKKIIDYAVKLEILELKVSRFLQQSSEEFVIQPRQVKEEVSMLKPEKYSKRFEEEVRRVSDTEKKVLRYLSEREYTAGELQSILGKTREHTTRMLQRLFKEGYIERSEDKRPYRYRLVEKEGIFTSE
jgi:predicted HTH transcriptional regulator